MSWLKNLGFVVASLLGLSIIAGQLLPRDVRMPDVNVPTDDNTFRQLIDTIDRQFEDAWVESNLEPASLADPWTLCRRLSLGLTGTIPSMEEIRMLRRIAPEQMTDWWLERLLQDRRFSDYLAERLARSYVGVEEGPFLVYRRRRFVTWLSDQISERRPYDQIVRELISGTGIWTDSPAVNFVTVTNDVNGDEQPDEERLAARTARAFLGIRLDCVQCHDDNLGGDWLQQDFQQLAAYFAGARSSLLGITDVTSDYEFQYLHKQASEVVAPAAPFKKHLVTEGETRREQLADWVTHADNISFGRAITNRVWALMLGRPLVTPVDDLPVDGPVPPGLDALAQDFASHGYDLRRLIRAIANSRPFQLSSQGTSPAREDSAWAVFPMTRLRPEQVAGSLTQAASLTTLDAESHILVRIARYEQQQEFVQRYGDTGEDEFTDQAQTIPQRLLLLNGELVRERTKDDLVSNAITRIAALVGDNAKAVDAVYWSILTRAPSAVESDHFVQRLDGHRGSARRRKLEDLCWVLFNCNEFLINH